MKQAVSGSLITAGVLGVLFDLKSQYQLVYSLRYSMVCAPNGDVQPLVGCVVTLAVANVGESAGTDVRRRFTSTCTMRLNGSSNSS